MNTLSIPHGEPEPDELRQPKPLGRLRVPTIDALVTVAQASGTLDNTQAVAELAVAFYDAALEALRGISCQLH